MKKIIYWIAFSISLVISICLLIQQTNSKFSIILISAIIVLIGYLIQELIGRVFKKQINQIYEIFTANETNIPKWTNRLREFCISIALTCFMASLGVDFATDFIKGNEISIIEINVLLRDLTLFFVYIGLLPQVIWFSIMHLK
jgi:hypothetical protein